MKRVILIFFCACIGVIIRAQQSSKVFIPIERIYDFGKILEKNGKVSHTFHFWNTGKKSVVINDISAWCGCTTYSFTKTPIRPGKKAEVIITYNPNNRPGFFSKEIVVLTEGGQNYTRIWIKGNVVPYLHPVTEDYPYAFGQGLYLGLKVLAFGSMYKKETKTIELRYANNTNRPMTLAFKLLPNDTDLKFTNPGMLKPMARSGITFTYTCPANYHFNRLIRIYPVVNGKCLSIPIQATFTK